MTQDWLDAWPSTGAKKQLMAGQPVVTHSSSKQHDQKQTLVTLSTTEAEWVSAARTCAELEWIVHLLRDFGIDESKLVTFVCRQWDRITKGKGENTKSESKTITLRCLSVKVTLQQGLLEIKCWPTKEMIADILTSCPRKGSLNIYKRRWTCTTTVFGLEKGFWNVIAS